MGWGLWAQAGPVWWATLIHLGDVPLRLLPLTQVQLSKHSFGAFIWLSRVSGSTLGVSALQTQKKIDRWAAWFYFRTIMRMATL